MKKYSLAHLSDLHADEAHLEEAVRCLSFALETSGQRKVDLVLFSGDLWNGQVVNMDGSALLPIVNCFTEFHQKYDIPVFMLYGTNSHDLPGSLDVFTRLDANITVCKVTSLVEIPPFSIIAFPFSRSTGTVPKEKILERLMNLSASAQNPIRIFTGHFGLQDVEEAAYSDIRMPDFETKDLIPLGAHYFGLGHIHQGESSQLTGNIRYSGSLFHTDYGDVSPKGFYIVNFKEVENNQYAFTGVERIHTPSTPILNLKEEDLANTDVKGKRVKVKIRVDPDEVGQDEEQLRQELFARGAVEVKIDRILMPKNEIRESLSDAETLSQKVEIWCRVTNRKWSESLVSKCEEAEAYA